MGTRLKVDPVLGWQAIRGHLLIDSFTAKGSVVQKDGQYTNTHKHWLVTLCAIESFLFYGALSDGKSGPEEPTDCKQVINALSHKLTVPATAIANSVAQ